MFPRMDSWQDGWEAIGRLRADPMTAEIPIIALSAYATHWTSTVITVISAIRAGAADVSRSGVVRPANGLQPGRAEASMRNQFLAGLLATALAPMALACSGPDSTTKKNEQRGGSRGTTDRVALKGCVQAAPGGAYELHGVSEVASARPAQGQDTSQERVRSGSFVRLSYGSDLTQYLGKEVTINGWIADTGQSTIGTTGKDNPGAKGESKDATTPTVAAPGASIANGNAPLVSVERVEAGGPCTTGR